MITANRRQAARFRHDHDLEQQAAGKRVWETPDILPWDAWLRRLWGEKLLKGSGATPRLLSNAQERLVWEQIIQDSPHGTALLQPAATAQRAQEAWQLLHSYRQPLPAREAHLSGDVAAFLDWAAEYQSRCEAHRWVDGARLPAVLEQCLEREPISLPEEIVLRGIDELTPAQRALLDAAGRRGCRVREEQYRGRGSQRWRVACSDAESEIRAAAQWVRSLLDRGETGRIGVVVHDLAARRQVVLRCFEDALNPSALLPGEARPPLYNISLGHPLADDPVIATALNWLELGCEPSRLDTERLGALLRSPFLEGGVEEMGPRARLDARLRQLGETGIGINGVRYYAAQGASAAPRFLASLNAWYERRRQLPRRQSASGWAGEFSTLLQLAGWPRGRGLDSNEYQAVEAWRAVLSELAALSEVSGPLGYSQALRKLRQLSQETLFQPRTPELPVQILGLLEAEGLTFDHLWIAGWHDEVWPAGARPNPLLPVGLQRRCRMPHSSAARELEFAQRVTGRLLDAAPEVIVSWPRREGDRELRHSPLIEPLPEIDPQTLASPIDYPKLVFDRAESELLNDERGLPLPEGETPRGGAALLREQAACPFRAYARFRLGGEPLGEPQPGLDAATRGSLLHQVLENFWEAVPGHAALLRLDAEQRRATIREAVRRAIEAEAKRRPATFSDRFRAIEQTRLEQRLASWLDIEAQRAPFHVVATETQREVEVDTLSLQARIDRIDRLEDGREIIIDYKSGKSTAQAWFGERPDEPQLPLYALSGSRPLAALAFAELRPCECRFRGLASERHLLPNVDAKVKGLGGEWSWKGLREEWQATLGALASAFRSGDARVDPKRGAATCRYCALEALCRINEASWKGEVGDE